MRYFEDIPAFLYRLICIFICIYLSVTILILIPGRPCEEEKVMSYSHKMIIGLLVIINLFINIKWIIPKLKRKDIFIIGLATIIARYDLSYSLIIFDVFNYFNYWG